MKNQNIDEYLCVRVTLVTLPELKDEAFQGNYHSKEKGLMSTATFSMGANDDRVQDFKLLSYIGKYNTYRKPKISGIQKFACQDEFVAHNFRGPKLDISIMISEDKMLEGADSISMDIDFISDDRTLNIKIGSVTFLVAGSVYEYKQWFLPIEFFDLRALERKRSIVKKSFLDKLKKRDSHPSINFCFMHDSRILKLSPSSIVNVGVGISKRYKSTLTAEELRNFTRNQDVIQNFSQLSKVKQNNILEISSNSSEIYKSNIRQSSDGIILKQNLDPFGNELDDITMSTFANISDKYRLNDTQAQSYSDTQLTKEHDDSTQNLTGTLAESERGNISSLYDSTLYNTSSSFIVKSRSHDRGKKLSSKEKKNKSTASWNIFKWGCSCLSDTENMSMVLQDDKNSLLVTKSARTFTSTDTDPSNTPRNFINCGNSVASSNYYSVESNHITEIELFNDDTIETRDITQNIVNSSNDDAKNFYYDDTTLATKAFHREAMSRGTYTYDKSYFYDDSTLGTTEYTQSTRHYHDDSTLETRDYDPRTGMYCYDDVTFTRNEEFRMRRKQ